MEETYPGELARKRCAKRTREELLEYAPQRPLLFRDELRIRAMRSRCEMCGACELVVRALKILSPPEPERPSAEIIRLAG